MYVLLSRFILLYPELKVNYLLHVFSVEVTNQEKYMSFLNEIPPLGDSVPEPTVSRFRNIVGG